MKVFGARELVMHQFQWNSIQKKKKYCENVFGIGKINQLPKKSTKGMLVRQAIFTSEIHKLCN